MDEDGEDVGERTSGPIRPLFFTLGNFGWTVREGGATHPPGFLCGFLWFWWFLWFLWFWWFCWCYWFFWF